MHTEIEATVMYLCVHWHQRSVPPGTIAVVIF